MLKDRVRNCGGSAMLGSMLRRVEWIDIESRDRDRILSSLFPPRSPSRESVAYLMRGPRGDACRSSSFMVATSSSGDCGFSIVARAGRVERMRSRKDRKVRSKRGAADFIYGMQEARAQGDVGYAQTM